MPARVTTPFVTLTASCTGAPAGVDVGDRDWLPPPELKTSGVSSGVVGVPGGKVISGASLTAVTLIWVESKAVSVPPEPVWPRSLIPTPRKSTGGGESEATT